MPYNSSYRRLRRRSAEGKKLDKMYTRHEIGWAYYNKICNKPKYWEWL